MDYHRMAVTGGVDQLSLLLCPHHFYPPNAGFSHDFHYFFSLHSNLALPKFASFIRTTLTATVLCLVVEC